jgi:hypothetical protein
MHSLSKQGSLPMSTRETLPYDDDTIGYPGGPCLMIVIKAATVLPAVVATSERLAFSRESWIRDLNPTRPTRANPRQSIRYASAEINRLGAVPQFSHGELARGGRKSVCNLLFR